MNTPSSAGSAKVTNSSCTASAFTMCTGIAPAVAPEATSAAMANAASRRKSRRPSNVQPPHPSDELVSVIESGIEEYDAGQCGAEPERDARIRAEPEAPPCAVAGGRIGAELFVRALHQIAIGEQQDDQRHLSPEHRRDEKSSNIARQHQEARYHGHGKGHQHGPVNRGELAQHVLLLLEARVEQKHVLREFATI